MQNGLGAATAAAWERIGRVVRMPAFGIVFIVPLVALLAVGASAPTTGHSVAADEITPLAAVASTGADSGFAVVSGTKPPTTFHFAVTSLSAPPPPIVVASQGSMRIPAIALSAYRNAERMMAGAYPGCGVSWNLLAGIGRIESLHANGGATDPRGTPLTPILGPTLDGTLAGNEVIVQSVLAGRVTYARAMGPMQFLPGTWARYASDGDGDGKADIQNLYDATLAAARYLCSGNLNLRDPSQVMAAILRYNNSTAYARNVLGWAAAYATGVEPTDLPPISGPAPLGDAHFDSNAEGLGPGLPLNAVGLPAGDPLATMPLVGPNGAPLLGAPGSTPGPAGAAPPQQNCRVFCLTPQAVPPPPQDAQAPLQFPLPPQFPPPPLPFGAPPPAEPVLPVPTGPAPGPAG